jgi:hypothetical protein
MFFRITVIFAVVFAFAVASASAHKYHTSLTRIDYNEKDKNLEISIRLFVHDVVPMLERRLKKRVDPARTPEVDAELQAYVSENFRLRTKDGTELALKWVGKEFETDVLFVYVETPFDGDPSGLELRNSILFDHFEEQTNLVVAKFGKRKFDLAFRSNDGFKRISPPAEREKTTE